jgi:N-acetylmuramoyl-L-alanine amidase
VVLDLGLRLRELLQDRLGVRVLMTRTADVLVPLEDRTAFANQAKAEFFTSLHLNVGGQPRTDGVETYYFTREPSDNDARASAQRENLVIPKHGATGKAEESLLEITLTDMAVSRDMKESERLAELLLGSLDTHLGEESRGVKSGPFRVLATAAMPAVLVENAFISNPDEERRLRQPAYLQRIAEALFEAIAKYELRYEQQVGRGRAAAVGS